MFNEEIKKKSIKKNKKNNLKKTQKKTYHNKNNPGLLQLTNKTRGHKIEIIL